MSEVVETKRGGNTTAEDTFKQVPYLAPVGNNSAVINIWVDPSEYAPGTKNQTMYK